MVQSWLIISLSISILICTVTSAEAASYNNFISITRDTTCQKTNCVDLKPYIQYDNSDKKISGHIYYNNKTHEYFRKGQLQNAHNYYNIFQNKTFVFVEPDQSTLVRSKQIILTASLADYIPPGVATKTEKSFQQTTRTTYTGVYVNGKCDKAVVGIEQNIDIKKVIEHLAGGCNTDLGNKNIITENKTNIKYCGVECQHQKWLKDAKILSRNNLLGNK